MKSYALLITLILFCYHINAQDKIDKIKLDRDAELLQTVDLGNNGILVKTGKRVDGSKNQDLRVRYYSSKLDLIWNVPIAPSKAKQFSGVLVSSPDGQYVYHVEMNEYGLKDIYFTQIDKAGKATSQAFEKMKDMGTNPLVIFCNNESLIILASEKGNEFEWKKKEGEKIFMHKFSHTDFSYSKSVLKLPPIEDPRNSSFWVYSGSDKNDFFLISKLINTDEDVNINKHTILTLNGEGEVTNTVVIDLKLNEKFVRPSDNENEFYGVYFYRGPTFYSGNAYTVNAFGNVKIDRQNNSIYISGLYGPESFRYVGAVYEGYFIYKYDMAGKFVSAIQKDVPDAKNDNFFRVHSTPDGRLTMLKINPDQNLKFQMWFKNMVYSFENLGEKYASYVNKYGGNVGLNEVNMSVSPSINLRSIQYIKSVDPKKLSNARYRYFNKSTSELLVEYVENESSLNVMYFDK